MTRDLEKKRKFFSLVLGKIRVVSLPFKGDGSDIALWRISTGRRHHLLYYSGSAVHDAYPTRFVNAPRTLPPGGTPAKWLSHWLTWSNNDIIGKVHSRAIPVSWKERWVFSKGSRDSPPGSPLGGIVKIGVFHS